MDRDRGTYQGVRKKYEDWVEIQKSKPLIARPRRVQTYSHEPQPSSEMGKTVFAAIGFGIGGLLLLLAVLAFVTAARWASLDGEGAAVGYTLVGIFLIIAGTGGIAATYNHNFRVLSPNRAHGGAHH